jgi:hypothetical protein
MEACAGKFAIEITIAIFINSFLDTVFTQMYNSQGTGFANLISRQSLGHRNQGDLIGATTGPLASV